ncbi:hypothetical protein PABY_19360 [Pyrodictium abyssi]|uniref:Methyltransferase FkbM domain-containing protein n=2 Tax=Pyrodictium abyssi TaxID=54256 RepID=A0ABN6ZQ76_9CREN|nr:hypothetical protein PABY_19360 [Pyrodictium abyssi]
MIQWDLFNIMMDKSISARLLRLALLTRTYGPHYVIFKLIKRFLTKERIIGLDEIANIVRYYSGLKVEKYGDSEYRIYWPEGDYVTVKSYEEVLLVAIAHNLSYKVVDSESAYLCKKLLSERCIVFDENYVEHEDIKISRRTIAGCPTCLAETMILKTHDVVRPFGKNVLDIGAWVGDSSLRLAKLGASRVVAVEPNPMNYSELLHNLELNPHIKDAIIPVHAAVDEDGEVKICYNSDFSGGSSIFRNGRYCDIVPSVSFKTLIEKYGPFDIIKLDCK